MPSQISVCVLSNLGRVYAFLAKEDQVCICKLKLCMKVSNTERALAPNTSRQGREINLPEMFKLVEYVIVHLKIQTH